MALPRLLAAGALLLTLLALLAATASPAAATARCGTVDLPGSRAWDIRATNVSCSQARSAAWTCLRGTVPAGWRIRHGVSREVLTSGRRRVSFTNVGGGGCGY